MANDFILGQNPFMQFTGLNAKFAAYGYMVTKDWDTREDKETFEEPTGTIALANPIPFDGIGRTVPIFWATDVPYYLEIYAQDDTLIWQSPEPYIPGIGGTSVLDDALDSVNLFSNGQFYSYPIQSYSPVPDLVSNLAMLGWGWRQNGTNVSDTLEFVAFNIDDNSISPPSVNYLRYTSLLNGTGETIKQLYFSIPNVRALANELVTVSFQCRSQIGGNFQLGVGVIQKFGTGGSADTTTLLGSVTLSTAFQQLSVTGTIPDLSGKTLGTGTSSLEIVIQYPLNVAQRIDIDNLYLKRGEAVNGFPYVDPYHDMAAIYGYNSHISTGDVKASYKTTPDIGWILADDGTIGNVGSGATNLAANVTYNLFKLYWDGVADSNAPVRFIYTTGTASQSGDAITGVGTTFTAAMEGGTITFTTGGQTATILDFVDATHLTVSTTATVASGPFIIKYGDKGVTPEADFLAGKTLRLPLTVGLPFAAAGTGFPLGSVVGSDLIVAANFPTGLTYSDTGGSHVHGAPPIPGESTEFFVLGGGNQTGGPVGGVYGASVFTANTASATFTIDLTGPIGAAGTPFVTKRSMVNVFIKL